MCEPFTMMTAGASILSTALGVAQQMQHAASQRGDYDYLAAQQRTDLLGSPIDVLGDLAATGAEDALSLSYQSMRDAWEHRARGAGRHRRDATRRRRATSVRRWKS